MFYVEITLLPALEISQAFLMSKLFSAIHIRLVELKDEKGNVNIGISFPEYSIENYTLGMKLRLIAQERVTLEKFEVKKTLRNYAEYAHFTNVRTVPEMIVNYSQFKRIQPTATPERLARRKAKYKHITYEEALEMIPKNIPNQISLPYVLIRSKSTNKGFSIFIKKEKTIYGEPFIFNTYGLSKGGALPDF